MHIVCFSLLRLLSQLTSYLGRTSSASTSNSSLIFAQDVSKLIDMLPPWATRSTKDKDHAASPPRDRGKLAKENKPSKEVLRSKSQPKRSFFPRLHANGPPDILCLQSGQSASKANSSLRINRLRKRPRSAPLHQLLPRVQRKTGLFLRIRLLETLVVTPTPRRRLPFLVSEGRACSWTRCYQLQSKI
jgi:hypothetical protein